MKVIAYTDGGSRSNPGPAGYGAVVRDAQTGQLLGTRSGFLGTTTNNVAEYTAVVEALRLVSLIDQADQVTGCEIRADSKLVVEQLSGRWKIKHADMRRLADLVRTTFDPARVAYTWVPRAENKDADALANQAMDARADDATDEWRGLLGEAHQTSPAPTEDRDDDEPHSDTLF